MYIEKLNDIANEYKNANDRAIKIKPIDVKSGEYIDFDVENNDKDPKFKVVDHGRISKYKNIFSKDYTTNWSEEPFLNKKSKNIVHEPM